MYLEIKGCEVHHLEQEGKDPTHKKKKRVINKGRAGAQSSQKDVITYRRTLLSALLLEVLIHLINTLTFSIITQNCPSTPDRMQEPQDRT